VATIKFSTDQLLKFLILLGFCILFYRVINSNEILQMIHPQFTAYTEFGFLLLLLLTVIQFFRIFFIHADYDCDCNHGLGGFFYMTFIGALFLGLIVPVKPLDSVIADQKGTKYLLGNRTTIEKTSRFQTFDDYESLLPAKKQIATSLNSAVPPVASPQSSDTKAPSILNITDKNHVRYMMLIYENTQAFIGREINIKGFVYRPKSLPLHQFMVARFEISCCAADGMPSGLVVESPDSTKFKNDTWVEVQGTIAQGTYENQPMPLLKAKKITVISPLPNPYVYTPDRVINPVHQQGIPQDVPSSAPVNWKN
jgi:putative membrane protein